MCRRVLPLARRTQFELSQQAFVEDTAGLKLTSLEDLLETSRRTEEPVQRQHVLAEVNLLLEAELGDVVKVNLPAGPQSQGYHWQ